MSVVLRKNLIINESKRLVDQDLGLDVLKKTLRIQKKGPISLRSLQDVEKGVISHERNMINLLLRQDGMYSSFFDGVLVFSVDTRIEVVANVLYMRHVTKPLCIQMDLSLFVRGLCEGFYEPSIVCDWRSQDLLETMIIILRMYEEEAGELPCSGWLREQEYILCMKRQVGSPESDEYRAIMISGACLEVEEDRVNLVYVEKSENKSVDVGRVNTPEEDLELQVQYRTTPARIHQYEPIESGQLIKKFSLELYSNYRLLYNHKFDFRNEDTEKLIDFICSIMPEYMTKGVALNRKSIVYNRHAYMTDKFNVGYLCTQILSNFGVRIDEEIQRQIKRRLKTVMRSFMTVRYESDSQYITEQLMLSLPANLFIGAEGPMMRVTTIVRREGAKAGYDEMVINRVSLEFELHGSKFTDSLDIMNLYWVDQGMWTDCFHRPYDQEKRDFSILLALLTMRYKIRFR